MKVQVAAVETLGSDVRVLELVAAGSEPLPEWTPGSHIDLHLGNELNRQYSLFGSTSNPVTWRIAVRLDAQSRGGSQWVHDHDLVGETLSCGEPRNNFELVEDAPEYLFLAGGIGITPFISMCAANAAGGRRQRLAFGAPRELLDGFLPEFRRNSGLRIDLFEASVGVIPIEELLADCPAGTAVYCCGPQGMLEATRSLARARGDLRLYTEAFTPMDVGGSQNQPVTVELATSGITFDVAANESILEAIVGHGIFLPSSCGEGTCGTCEVAVLAGTPEHRDAVTDPDDPDRDKTMMVCVSRARSERLVLDL